MSENKAKQVIHVFEAQRARWVLVGAHAIGILTEPRATEDFDFVVQGDKVDAVLAALRKKFGRLGEEDIGVAVRLKRIDIDLIRSTSQPLFEQALVRPRRDGDYRIPRPEVLVVLKFLASVSPARDRDKRGQDILDLRRVYRAVGKKLKRDEAIRLSGLVYPGAEHEFRDLLDRIDRDEPIAI